jgi:hypothetical protein
MLSDFSSIGDFPHQCTTMAISMGSGNGTTQGFAAGAPLIGVHDNPASIMLVMTSLDVLLSVLGIVPPGIVTTAGAILSSVNIDVDVNAVPSHTQGVIFDEQIGMRVCVPKVRVEFKWWWGFLGIPPIIIPYLDCDNDINRIKVSVNNTEPLDNAPGSVKGWHNLTDFDYGQVAKFLNNFTSQYINTKYDCFIPSYSALSLNQVSPHSNIINYLNNNSSVSLVTNNLYKNTSAAVSPFDYLYIENDNLDHIYDKNGEGVMSDDMLKAMYLLITNNSSNINNIVQSSILFLTPNPANSNVTVEYNLSSNVSSATINIYGSAGNLVQQTALNINNNQQTISVSGLQIGTYSVVLVTDNVPSDTKTLVKL